MILPQTECQASGCASEADPYRQVIPKEIPGLPDAKGPMRLCARHLAIAERAGSQVQVVGGVWTNG